MKDIDHSSLNEALSKNLLLSAAPIQGSPQRMFVKHSHTRFGSILRRMPFLTQLTDSREEALSKNTE